MYKSNPWTDYEISLLRHNILPAGRSMAGARYKASVLGIPFRPTKQDTEVSNESVEYKQPGKIPWSDYEVSLLRNNIVPPSRSKACAYAKAHNMGILFHPTNKQSNKHQTEKISENYDAVADELMNTHKIRATARKFGLSYSAVWYIARDLGLTTKTKRTQDVD